MISQQQTQKQQLKILPQQIQLLNLYFLNSIELEQRIKNEMNMTKQTLSLRMLKRIIRTGKNITTMMRPTIKRNTRTILVMKMLPIFR